MNVTTGNKPKTSKYDDTINTENLGDTFCTDDMRTQTFAALKPKS